MCFSQSQPAAPPGPGAAPPPPQENPPPAEIGSARKAANVDNYGDSKGPQTRVDRSSTAGGIGSGGSGLRM